MDKKLKGNKQIQKLLHNMMHSEAFGWPPVCSGPYFQPVRPLQTQSGKESNSIKPKHNNEQK